MDSFQSISVLEPITPSVKVQEYTYGRGRMLTFALGAGLFTAGGLFLSLNKSLTGQGRTGLLFSAAFFGLCFLVFLSRLFVRGPAFVISPDGFRVPNFANETIAWADIIALNRTKFKGTDSLKLTIDPAAAASLTRPSVAKSIQRATGWKSNAATVLLSHLNCDPDTVARQCAAYVEAARRAMPEDAVLSRTLAVAEFKLHRPWLTYVLLAVLAIVYVEELQFAVNANKDGAPSVQTLAYLGGTIGNRIWINDEWWRLFTAPLLHGSPLHILLNSIVLWSAGTALERLIGWRWLAAIFAASALTGSLGSVLINPPNIVGVGASGGIMGLLSALFVISFRLPEGGLRMQLQMRAMQTVIPALLPFLSGGTGQKIDYAAHLGGAVVGGLIALLVRQLWPNERPEPRFGLLAATFALLFFLIALGSIIPIMHLRQLAVR